MQIAYQSRRNMALKPLLVPWRCIAMCKKCKSGGYALWSLTRYNDENCVVIPVKHVIEAIVSAMTAQNNIPEVQGRGCLALFSLTFNESVAVRIGIEGGVAVLEHNPRNYNAKRALQRIRPYEV
jgi:hypothetical protein